MNARLAIILATCTFTVASSLISNYMARRSADKAVMRIMEQCAKAQPQANKEQAPAKEQAAN